MPLRSDIWTSDHPVGGSLHFPIFLLRVLFALFDANSNTKSKTEDELFGNHPRGRLAREKSQALAPRQSRMIARDQVRFEGWGKGVEYVAFAP